MQVAGAVERGGRLGGGERGEEVGEDGFCFGGDLGEGGGAPGGGRLVYCWVRDGAGTVRGAAVREQVEGGEGGQGAAWWGFGEVGGCGGV